MLFNADWTDHVHAGQIVANLVNAAVQLTDSPQGAGGFVVVPGSHKSNFPPPASTEQLYALAEAHGVQPAAAAGDVILFAEAVRAFLVWLPACFPA